MLLKHYPEMGGGSALHGRILVLNLMFFLSACLHISVSFDTCFDAFNEKINMLWKLLTERIPCS